MNAVYAQLVTLETYQAQHNQALSHYYSAMGMKLTLSETTVAGIQLQHKQALAMVILHLRYVLTDKYPMGENQMLARTAQRVRNDVAALPAVNQQKIAKNIDTLLDLLGHQNCHLLSMVWPLDIVQWQDWAINLTKE